MRAMDTEEYVEAVSRHLRWYIQRRHRTVAAFDRALGRGQNYTGQQLRGSVRMTVKSLVEALLELEVRPSLFLAEVEADLLGQPVTSRGAVELLLRDALEAKLAGASSWPPGGGKAGEE